MAQQMAHQTFERDGVTIRIFRNHFMRPGFYAEAWDAQGRRVAVTRIFAGKGSKQKALEAVLLAAKADRSMVKA